MKVKKAVIPAAGYGTRFLPVTKAIPKEMLPIVDTPTIEYIVREALESGIKDILIIVSSNKNAIVDHFDRNFELEHMLKEKNKLDELEKITSVTNECNIFFVRQKEQLGLGHAVLCAKEFVGNEPFALLLGDDLYVGEEKPALKQLLDAYDKVETSVVGTLYVDDCDVSKYGICSLKDFRRLPLLELDSLIEKPALEDAPSNLAIGGRYILTPKIFELLETQKRGAGNEIQLTDSINRLLDYEKVYSYEISGRRYDIGSVYGFVDATLDFALKREDIRDRISDLIYKKRG